MFPCNKERERKTRRSSFRLPSWSGFILSRPLILWFPYLTGSLIRHVGLSVHLEEKLKQRKNNRNFLYSILSCFTIILPHATAQTPPWNPPSEKKTPTLVFCQVFRVLDRVTMW